MRSSIFKNNQEAKYPDEIYQLAADKKCSSSTNTGEVKQLLERLTKMPSSKLSIIPQLKGLLLSYELAEDDEKNQSDIIIKFDELFKKHESLIDKQNYYTLLKDFLKIIYFKKDLSNQVLFITYLYETLSHVEGIKELSNFVFDSTYKRGWEYVAIGILNTDYGSLWKQYTEMPLTLLVAVTLILYDAQAISAWMGYMGELLKQTEKTQASEACGFIECFNLTKFSAQVLNNKNFELFIEILYKLVEKEIFPAKYFVDLVDRFFEVTKNNDFPRQLGSNIADKLYYFQGKSFLCGMDKSRAIQALESISECDKAIYGKACYEIGTYYSTISNDIIDDDSKKEALCEKAKSYLLKAQQYEPENAEHIGEVLKNLVINPSTMIQNSK